MCSEAALLNSSQIQQPATLLSPPVLSEVVSWADSHPGVLAMVYVSHWEPATDSCVQLVERIIDAQIPRAVGSLHDHGLGARTRGEVLQKYGPVVPFHLIEENYDDTIECEGWGSSAVDQNHKRQVGLVKIPL